MRLTINVTPEIIAKVKRWLWCSKMCGTTDPAVDFSAMIVQAFDEGREEISIIEKGSDSRGQKSKVKG